MKKNVLALAGCIATVTPSISIANVISENLVGLNLGELHTSTYLNQPFKGVIPFIFSNYENTKNLKIRLASETIFNKVGLEKDPVLDNLSFQVTKQKNKPVILISSNKPINLPFLNFILEIQGPAGSIYQDYTVLLDPKQKKVASESKTQQLSRKKAVSESDISNGRKFDKHKLEYRVKAGDTLSKIAQNYISDNSSVKTMSQLIHQNNPKAFIRGDVNRIRKGAILSIPTTLEINSLMVSNAIVESKNTTNVQPKKTSKSNTNSYTVLNGDSLSKITKKFVSKDISFTKLMNAIYIENPTAFSNKSKNSLKAGVVLSIPLIAAKKLISEKNSETQVKTNKNLNVESKQYQIKQGDTLSYIAKEMGYPEVPFAKMLKAIYINNPNAFIDGKMTNLLVGSILTIPSLNSLEKRPLGLNTELKSATNIENKRSLDTNSNSANVTTSELIKRIRELRKELQLRKKSLSDLKIESIKKENLLQQKTKKIESLNSLLTKFERNIAPELVTDTSIKTKLEIDEKSDLNKLTSSVELTNIHNDLLTKQEITINQLEEIEELRSSISEPNLLLSGVNRQAYFKSSDLSQLNLSNKNYYYLTMALVLGLLLIRYRRELYSYTYSVINYDQPNYYPLQNVDNYELKEININYHDPKMDQDETNYVLLPVTKDAQEIVIDPNLVEATKEDDDVANDHIEEHDQMLSELLADLKSEEKTQDSDLNSKDNENLVIDEGFDNLPFLLKSFEREIKGEKNNDLDNHGFPDLFEDDDQSLSLTKRKSLEVSYN